MVIQWKLRPYSLHAGLQTDQHETVPLVHWHFFVFHVYKSVINHNLTSFNKAVSIIRICVMRSHAPRNGFDFQVHLSCHSFGPKAHRPHVLKVDI